MIKFFRRIRYDLMEKNKTGKYFKYAVGEIVLVVIGILIALQINNWNEQRKQDKLENEYYCRLLEDVQQDIEQIERLEALSRERLTEANDALRLLNLENTSKIEIGRKMGNSIKAIYSDFTPNSSAFEDLKSGANLNIIKDKNIIKALNNYFKKVEEYLSVIKVNSENAVGLFFNQKDLFANGWVDAGMEPNGRLYLGLEKDVYDAMPKDKDSFITSHMKERLYNETLVYVSSNHRHLELYGFMRDEINLLYEVLEPKCINQ